MSASGANPRQLGSTAARILSLLAAGVALAVLSSWISTSYFRIDVVGSLIWPGWDGYCVEGAQSLGVHCFSDLSQFLVLNGSMDPEGSNPFIRNYPPINRTIFWLFQMLALHVDYGFSVGLYVAVSATCLLVPVLWAVRGRPWTQQILIVSLAGVATFPFLAALDRGNNIAFVVPFLVLVVVGLRRNLSALTLVGIVGASQIKPQFGALVIALIVLRRFRLAVIVIVSGLAIFLTSFLLVLLSRPALSPLQEFKGFILYTRYYDQYLPLDSGYPPNASFAHLVALVQRWMGVSLLSETQLQFTTALVVILFMVVVMWRGNRLPFGLWFPAVLMAISLTPAISFAYYLAGALVVVALVIKEPFASEVDSGSRPLVGLLTAAIVVSLTPLLIPLGGVEAPVPVLGEGVTISLLPRVAAALWAVYLVAVAVASVRRPPASVPDTDRESRLR